MENKVLALVNGREVTEADLEFLLKGLPPQQAMQFNSEAGRNQLLQELINQELLYLDAKEKGIDETEEFKMELKKSSENLLKQYAIRDLLAKVEVSDEEVVDYYNNNKEQFKTGESAKASHILVDSEEEAINIIKEIKNETSFEEAATKYSKCPSKERGGDLGYFTKGKMVPEFEKAAFEINIGEISEPVKTQFGYHIIKVDDKKEESIKTLDEVKDQLKQQLLAMKQNSLYIEETNKLKEKYKVEVK